MSDCLWFSSEPLMRDRGRTNHDVYLHHDGEVERNCFSLFMILSMLH